LGEENYISRKSIKKEPEERNSAQAQLKKEIMRPVVGKSLGFRVRCIEKTKFNSKGKKIQPKRFA